MFIQIKIYNKIFSFEYDLYPCYSLHHLMIAFYESRLKPKEYTGFGSMEKYLIEKMLYSKKYTLYNLDHIEISKDSMMILKNDDSLLFYCIEFEYTSTFQMIVHEIIPFMTILYITLFVVARLDMYLSYMNIYCRAFEDYYILILYLTLAFLMINMIYGSTELLYFVYDQLSEHINEFIAI